MMLNHILENIQTFVPHVCAPPKVSSFPADPSVFYFPRLCAAAAHMEPEDLKTPHNSQAALSDVHSLFFPALFVQQV